MSREVFVDASAWIAVSNRHDKYFTAASTAYSQIIHNGIKLITTNLIIAEAYILIRRTGGYAPAMRWLESLHGSPRLEKVYSDSYLETQAQAVLEKNADQAFSYADAVSFVVMQERKIEQAFTFDSHFASMGFQMLP